MRHLQQRSRAGFTLIELMIVVAILGVLSTIAIPRYLAIQYQARRAEVPTLVDSLHTAQTAYHAATDKYLIVDTFVPRSTPNRYLEDWPTGTDFAKLDWNPDGAVRGIYKISGDEDKEYQITGRSDVDGDGIMAEFYATQATPVERATPALVF